MRMDYLDSAIRHRKDADLLYENRRWPNADQLYGFAAECGLKAIMEALGMRLLDGKPKDRRYRVHIDRLWREFLSFASRKGANQYATKFGSDNPFFDWSVDQRYWCSAAITQAVVDAHKMGTERVFEALTIKQLDGERTV